MQGTRDTTAELNENKITNVLIVAYLTIRIGLANALSFLPASSNISIFRDLIEFGLFLCLAALIWVNLTRLGQYQIDAPTLLLLALSATIIKTFYSDQVLTWVLFAAWIIITLFIGLHISRSKKSMASLQSTKLFEALIGGAIGALLASIIALPRIITNNEIPFANNALPQILGMFSFAFIAALTHSAILEEPFFRGFLWGHLRNRIEAKWGILLVQTFIFWVAHLRLIDTPYSFFVTVPLGGLIFGAIVWRTESLTPAILAHVFYNATSSILQ